MEITRRAFLGLCATTVVTLVVRGPRHAWSAYDQRRQAGPATAYPGPIQPIDHAAVATPGTWVG